MPINEWVARSSPANSGHHGAVWAEELGLFVVVSYSSTSGVYIITSPDGINWTARTAPQANAWRSVCWSPELGLFVAVATDGASRIMTSSDGISWTGRTAPGNNAWVCVCWSSDLGLFVAVSISGAGSRVMSSPDGINWTLRTTPSRSYISVIWVSELGLFIAGSNTASTGSIMTSPDGENWTERVTPSVAVSGFSWSSDLGLLVLVTLGGPFLLSTDGINWSQTPSPASGSWGAITWLPARGVFFSVAYSGAATRSAYSADGISWTLKTTPDNSKHWRSLCWSPSLMRLVAVAYDSTGTRVITLDFSKVTFNLIENIASQKFLVSAIRTSDGEGLGARFASSGPDVELALSDNAGVYLTVTADQGKEWKPNESRTVNSKTYPTDSAIKPYYFKALNAGSTGLSEPDWPTEAGSQIVDNGITWELVDRLVQPVTHGPLIPT